MMRYVTVPVKCKSMEGGIPGDTLLLIGAVCGCLCFNLVYTITCGLASTVAVRKKSRTGNRVRGLSVASALIEPKRLD